MSINSGPTRAWPKAAPGIDNVLSGRAFVAGGKITVTDGTAVFQLANPAGSGKAILLQSFSATADTGVDVQFSKNATVATPSTRGPSNLSLASALISVAVFRTGITGTTGGTNISPVSRLLPNDRQEYPIPFFLPPGTSLELKILAPVLTTIVCYGAAVWTENPL